MKEIIKYDDFAKLDLVVGKILFADKVPNTDKLIKIIVDLGNEERQIVSGIADFYSAQDLVGKQIIVLKNLESRKFKGLESQGMLLAADLEGRPVLLTPEEELPPGSPVK
ncbi:MAG: methionine--tRNA ligase subunit beta [Candidatus Aenigmarchaeota archaeon]|nr:methionine--tRNA ligase subunit beta [Candidatus Aenigmarchaeota archaeon]